MATLFVSNESYDFSNFSESTDATFYDADYVNKALGLTAARVAIYQSSFTHPVSSTSTTWYHFEMFPESSDSYANSYGRSLADGEGWRLYDESGNFIFRIFVTDGVWTLRTYGSSNVDSATTFTLPFEVLTTYDIKVVINDGSGNNVVEIYSNGTLVASATAVNDGEGKPNNFVFYQDSITGQTSGTATVYYSEVIVSEDSTIGARLAKLDPTTNGDLTDWNGGASDLTDDDLATKVTSNTTGDQFTVNLSTYNGPSSPAAIRSVIVSSRVSAGLSGPTGIEHLLRISSTNYNGANKVVDEPSQLILTEWETNPNTSSAWATGDLSSLQSGAEST